MEDKQALTAKQKGIIPIAAFTANGDIEKLKIALNEGQDAGLTVNEIKEVIVHLYAYVGFPRSLNGIHAFMAVVDDRKNRGITDEIGKDAGPLPPDMNKDEYGANVRAQLAGLERDVSGTKWQLFAPAMDTFLKEHLFADLFARDNLDYQGRELATNSALANMSGTAGQLGFHLGAMMNVGLTEGQMKDFISVLEKKVGQKEAKSASAVLDKVLEARR